jgi:transcriptional regulator with GAF, ATPase, and Fis domain
LRRTPGITAAPSIIGTSSVITELKEEIDRVAKSDAKVLITGESGVGKELVAHAVHARSPRSARPFIAVNCAGLPETLLESELFGHVRGSFTGAYRDKAGKLEQSDGGTVFLDEVGEMTLRMQGLLLRFLGTGELQKVGADRMGARIDVRVITATNRNLAEMVLRGEFREDLYYRIKVVHINVPALREHKTDIPLLVDHFMRKFSGRQTVVTSISPEALELLKRHSWPGNVRELENAVERLMVTCPRPVVRPDDLPDEIRTPVRGEGTRRRERRHTVADDLYKQLKSGQSFWTAVYPLYMQREITRSDLRDVVRRGLEEARGSYKIVARLFNLDPGDYKRFLNFLRKHECQPPFKEFRT